MVEQREYDICIIGAGVAGGTLAAYLGKHGLRVCVIEKTFTEQERIVGELLQPGGVIKLTEMGLSNLLEGFDAQPVYGYGLFLNGEHFQVAYPADETKASGFGFKNHKLIKKIRDYLGTLPSVELIEGTVTELIEEEGTVSGVKYLSKETREEILVHANLTVVCDGMHSAFREGLSTTDKKVTSYFLGLVLKNCPLPYPNHGHVIIAQPSPCLVYPISSNETRILIDFPQPEAPRKSQELTDYLKHVVLPQLPESIQPSFATAVDEGKFKVMPNHYFPAQPVQKPGVVLIGDSLNMRHPLTGGGMTAAFTDIKLLGDLLIEGRAKAKEQTGQAEIVKQFYETRHKQNATINILADALYGVMRSEDLKQACFDYLKRGGIYAEEPVSLLSAVSRDQELLLRHFFAVAIYGMRKLPRVKRIKRSKQMLHDAVNIVSPLVLNEKPGLLTKYAMKASQAIF